MQGIVTKQSVASHAYRDCITVSSTSFDTLINLLSNLKAPHLLKDDYITSNGILCAITKTSSSTPPNESLWATVQKDNGMNNNNIGFSGLHRASLSARLGRY